MSSPRSTGLLLGYAADLYFADPRRGHPVAAFGTVAGRLRDRLYADDRRAGAVYAATLVAGTALLGVAAERATRRSTLLETVVTAAATWTVLGGSSLRREAATIGGHLRDGDLAAARERLPHLCGRDPRHLDQDQIARAVVESVAENTSDAVVAPLFWGAVAGVPGLLAYRAANTLDAMVGYKNERYLRFGWASARLDDVLNLAPARVTGAVTVAVAPLVGGSPRTAARVLRRDGARHPSPNAGRCEASAAGALGVRLGGTNTYGDVVEHRPVMGEGRAPRVGDVARAAKLSAAIGAVAVVGAARVARRLAKR
jgi:adenosylcobinamide-phosphate synthase